MFVIFEVSAELSLPVLSVCFSSLEEAELRVSELRLEDLEEGCSEGVYEIREVSEEPEWLSV